VFRVSSGGAAMDAGDALTFRITVQLDDKAAAMRLTQYQQDEVRRAVRELAGAEARVRLFGSRLDDSARGGDIDLLVELPSEVSDEISLACQIAGRISHRLGGQKVDVLVAAANSRLAPVHKVARSEGVIL